MIHFVILSIFVTLLFWFLMTRIVSDCCFKFAFFVFWGFWFSFDGLLLSCVHAHGYGERQTVMTHRTVLLKNSFAKQEKVLNRSKDRQMVGCFFLLLLLFRPLISLFIRSSKMFVFSKLKRERIKLDSCCFFFLSFRSLKRKRGLLLKKRKLKSLKLC